MGLAYSDNISQNDNSILLTLCAITWLLLSFLQIRAGRYSIYVELLTVLTFFYCFRYKFENKSRILFFYCCYIIILFLYGLCFNVVALYIYGDVLAFSAIFAAAIFGSDQIQTFLELLPKILWYSILVGLPVFFILFFYMDYKPGSLNIARFYYDSNTNLQLYSPIVLLQPALFLLFFSSRMKTYQLFVIALAFILILYMGLVTISRNIFFAVSISLVLYFMFIKKNDKKVILLFAVSIALLYASESLIISSLDLYDSKIAVLDRIGNEDTFSNRGIEQSEYLSNIDVSTFIFGKGLGGLKVLDRDSDYIGGAEMMHFGWTHLIMKGGVIMLFITYGCGIYAIIKLWSTEYKPYSIYLIYFLVQEIVHNHWMTFGGGILYWLVIGASFNVKRLKTGLFRF